jgi:hypothetical protein
VIEDLVRAGLLVGAVALGLDLLLEVLLVLLHALQGALLLGGGGAGEEKGEGREEEGTAAGHASGEYRPAAGGGAVAGFPSHS